MFNVYVIIDVRPIHLVEMKHDLRMNTLPGSLSKLPYPALSIRLCMLAISSEFTA